VFAILTPIAALSAPLDTPTLESHVQGHEKIVGDVIAGPSGAPTGFTMQWMKFSDFLANGGHFFDASANDPSDLQSEAKFTGVPTLNTWGGTLTSFTLEPSATAAVEIGDLFDETGVATDASAELELLTATPYILRVRANGAGARQMSTWSNVVVVSTIVNRNCTFTIGYWNTHGPEGCQNGNNTNEWPVTSLTLGTVTYTDLELCSILNEPAQGNGLVSLAHQLIATLLNEAQGADVSDVSGAIASAQ